MRTDTRKRITIVVDTSQERKTRINTEATRCGVTPAEIVRRAVDAYLPPPTITEPPTTIPEDPVTINQDFTELAPF